MLVEILLGSYFVRGHGWHDTDIDNAVNVKLTTVTDNISKDSKHNYFYRAAYMQGGLRDGKRVRLSVRPSVRHTREL